MTRDIPEAQLPADFDPEVYLKLNQDVAAAGVDAAEHYLQFGIAEDRTYRVLLPDSNLQTISNNDSKLLQTLRNSASFRSFDESPHPTLKHSTYFNVYDELFAQYRGRPITFVEVGLLDGGSLFMWRSFFGPKARIIGVDLNPECLKWESEGFDIFIGDQGDPEFWREFREQVGSIDILVDDGGHSYEEQIATVEGIAEVVLDGGMVVVEDTHTSYMTGFGDEHASFINFVKDLLDGINSRFGQFSCEMASEPFWSIEVFESIVALKVNRSRSLLKSVPILNKTSKKTKGES